MNQLATYINRIERLHMVEEGIRRQLLQGIFEEHRDRTIRNYCRMMRHHDAIDRFNEMFRESRRFPHPQPSRDWCSAAVHILVITDESTQRFFLSSEPAIQDRMVQCVLADGGAERFDGFWSELPV